MSTFDTAQWYRSQWQIDYRLLVSEPDAAGYIAVLSRSGYYGLVAAADLTLIPERHTFERRMPKKGERYAHLGTLLTADYDRSHTHWVVVDDEVTP